MWILQTAKSQTQVAQTHNLLNRLILNAVQTGCATVIAAALNLALFVKFTDTNYYLAFNFVLGKLYTNSFMMNLNMRMPRKDPRHSESINMHIQVSQSTDRTDEGDPKRRPFELEGGTVTAKKLAGKFVSSRLGSFLDQITSNKILP